MLLREIKPLLMASIIFLGKIKMWMDEKEISYAMYEKCKKSDKKIYWENITNSYWSYKYCKNIKDRPEVRQYITDSDDTYFY